ncbi:centrosome-associated zinc finger protein CP190 isoform X2 [Athalia rosae]|nr:centrosome-associated zinc finger protein CP190 isoform X2 [Athalia rosae]XP_012254613.2 centrosome-associated zinc finger protein CP190 isoform X2 [Athalia rosae]XP_048504720.1 centrosome-associated zinc finger protein CP190 isoform X2 [Athalia rosae]XP_048504721.1 centrosome-associated zinc finger protein CP190 isoform X2 [Athalia rosae]
MQSNVNQAKPLPSRGLKQVKVDNWGTFFLQRLQQLYFEEELLDLTIRFPTSDITVQAHRLVITTCTDYFTQLERQLREKDDNFDGILVMPPDMPYECVKSIISFMYTGQLEYWTSEQNALYRTAQKMNMAVLTKLLDAQFNTSELQISPAAKPKSNIQPIMTLPKPATPTKKVLTSTSQTPTLPAQPLPGRKLPIWKRKIDSAPSTPMPSYDMGSYATKSFHQRNSDSTPGPSRFDVPEVEDFALGVFSSFDDITYNTKPIVRAPSSNDEGDDGDKAASKRSRDEDGRYRNDSTEDEDGDNHGGEDAGADNSDDDWGGPKSILRPQEPHPSPAKRVRFDLEEKENLEKTKGASSPTNSADAISNHAKIIREVLKKYPHLVRNNKNIRLKIMQKEAKSAETNAPTKTKVSYVVLKSDHLMGSGGNGETTEELKGSIAAEGGETGPWKCNRCDVEEEYTSYYMFRRHMQDVHEEKFDPRICEHCGYKATKRNILMYHLYTKHNVPPPKSMSFPKCHACSYVALSENLLVRHQINHKHRPASHQQTPATEGIQCSQCTEIFADATELAAHEMNSGHGSGGEIRDKAHRCPHCGKLFVRATNLEVHIDCVHKNVTKNTDVTPATPITLEPSSEAEALSHVASGIAASLGVGDAHEQVITTDQTEYIVPALDISGEIHNLAYNGQEVGEEQQMVMLIDNSTYQHIQGGDHQQTVHQLNVAVNEQIVMQGDEDGMIVYVHENDEVTQQHYQVDDGSEMCQETEEIVEEVVEEVEEEVEELGEAEEVEEAMEGTEEVEHAEEVQEVEEEREEHSVIEEGNDDQSEEVVQYVEEETEILEYQEDQSNEQSQEPQQLDGSLIIMEEQQVDAGEIETTKEDDQRENIQADNLADEWDDDSADAGAS